MAFMTRRNKVAHWNWRQRSQFCSMNRGEKHVHFSLWTRTKRLCLLSMMRTKKQKIKGVQFSRNKQTHNIGSHTHNLKKDNYFCLPILFLVVQSNIASFPSIFPNSMSSFSDFEIQFKKYFKILRMLILDLP